MIKSDRLSAGKMRTLLMGVGIVACLCGVAYSFFVIQKESGKEGQYTAAADELATLARQVAISAQDTRSGQEQAFARLSERVAQFETQLAVFDAPELNDEISMVDLSWQPIKRASQTLVDASPRVVFVQGVATELEKNVKPMQRELTSVVTVLQRQNVSTETLIAAQKAPWLLERMLRNVDRTLEGGSNSQVAADEFSSDAADFFRIIEGLTRGDELIGINKVTNTSAIEALSNAFRMFSGVSTSVDRITGASTELRQAALARQAIAENSIALNDAIAALQPAVSNLAVGRLYGAGNLLVLFVAPGLLALGLLIVLLVGQRRREVYTARGVAEVNTVLEQVSKGDLTVTATEQNSVTSGIAQGLNKAVQNQCALIRDIRMPFEAAVDAIDSIGASAQAQVEKGRELTRSVVESTETATEMVRTSEEIKQSTAEASETSERNCKTVARGYELTQDMSKASADVRESVQETSKSAKRQGELIQSVTAAAEYIQALNTKISVVAINTRIEAEKAGEYGRPFLGIAESIADLLREAEEEGRKIISEVRMLQNMSADNLASMENTVGTVVTILEYIDRLDTSLEEINAGSDAISEIIRNVDDAAGQSAVNALHMSSSMAEIRERNLEISELNETAQKGVNSLQRSMREAAQNLGQFRIDGNSAYQAAVESEGDVNELESIRAATQVYREEEMSALESAEKARASL
ncbi:methyl-accepting chemotaxis protein [Pseudohalioglobus sediminis]|nr:methyl-accepting chemotaxis protein [Pseudohalioglobus sediminis]